MDHEAIAWAREAGRLLLDSFGAPLAAARKGDVANVVTAADQASERLIVSRIADRHPTHAILAEESGFRAGSSAYTWIVDPLDGTSNFAAGIPWFGVLIALLRDDRPIAAVAHLPVPGDTYFAAAGEGAYRNGQRIAVTASTRLGDVLWGYGMDIAPDAASGARRAAFLAALLHHVRNVRSTNCLLDAAYTADGRLGGFVNFDCMIWDIAAPSLILGEAAGLCTALDGTSLSLEPSAAACERHYAVLAGAPALHAQVRDLLAEAGLAAPAAAASPTQAPR